MPYKIGLRFITLIFLCPIKMVWILNGINLEMRICTIRALIYERWFTNFVLLVPIYVWDLKNTEHYVSKHIILSITKYAGLSTKLQDDKVLWCSVEFSTLKFYYKVLLLRILDILLTCMLHCQKGKQYN